MLLSLRQRFANWLLRDVRLRSGRFGENTIDLSPSGVGDLLRWSSSQPALALGDLGQSTTTGRASGYINGADAPYATQADILALGAGESINTTTADAVEKTMATRAISTTSVETITARVECRDTGGTLWGSFVRTARVYREGGIAVLGIVQDDYTDKSNAALDCTIDVSGNDARVRVTGIDATNIEWEGVLVPGVADGGKLLQVVSNVDGAYSTTTSIILVDDGIPEITEGSEVITRSITPLSAASSLRVTAWGLFSNTVTTQNSTMAVFRDATINALGVGNGVSPVSGVIFPMYVQFVTPSNAAVTTTFRMRMGPSAAATLRINGSSARRFGGKASSGIMIEEFAS